MFIPLQDRISQLIVHWTPSAGNLQQQAGLNPLCRIAVIKDGQIILAKGYGLANVEL